MKQRHILFLWLFFLYAYGVLHFLQGFLLTRREVHLKSTTFDGVSCCLAPKYKQIVILVIDALRYDFLVYNNSTSSRPIYHNNFPVVQKLLRDNHAILYQVCISITAKKFSVIPFNFLVCCRSSNHYHATSEGYDNWQFANFH